MTNAVLKLSGNTTDTVLAHLAQISKELSPQEQLSQLNDMLAMLSDLKATEGIIQARKNDLILQLHGLTKKTETSQLSLVKSSKEQNTNVHAGIDWVSDYTGRAKATIYDWVHKRKIPHIKKGSRLAFHKQEIIDWWAQHRRHTEEEIKRGVLNKL